MAEVAKNKTSLTGKYLTGVETIEVPQKRRQSNDFITIKGARQHNLKGVTARFSVAYIYGGYRGFRFRQNVVN
jgi:excinuclease UvrABC ATPase subunit